MIDRFQPAYFNYAPEISEPVLNEPARFDRFKQFASQVYQTLKTAHPDLPLMVSIALKSPGSQASQAIAEAFTAISEYVDIVGISVYPYAFFDDYQQRGDPANLPTDWLSQITTIAPENFLVRILACGCGGLYARYNPQKISIFSGQDIFP